MASCSSLTYTASKRSVFMAVVFGYMSVFVSGCYLYHDRGKALIPKVDIDQTLEVAEVSLAENRLTSVLTLWAIRDQVLTSEQARKISKLYFKYIDRIDSDEQKAREFSVWHLTWAISNMYRLGDQDIKQALKAAYVDAAARVDRLDSNVATTHFYDDELYMGDAHFGGRRYARTHIVAPGNDKYLQSFEEYVNSENGE